MKTRPANTAARLHDDLRRSARRACGRRARGRAARRRRAGTPASASIARRIASATCGSKAHIVSPSTNRFRAGQVLAAGLAVPRGSVDVMAVYCADRTRGRCRQSPACCRCPCTQGRRRSGRRRAGPARSARRSCPCGRPARPRSRRRTVAAVNDHVGPLRGRCGRNCKDDEKKSGVHIALLLEAC